MTGNIPENKKNLRWSLPHLPDSYRNRLLIIIIIIIHNDENCKHDDNKNDDDDDDDKIYDKPFSLTINILSFGFT